MHHYKAYAKVNIFLKISGKRGSYHEIVSRFMRVESLYDTLYFLPKESNDDSFELRGDFSCETKQNTIYRAYEALKEATNSSALESLMRQNALVVEKKIPAFAGLGGGSSDAATYLLMCNERLEFGLSKEELARIGAKVGADVPFFVYGFKSANVSGIGEIVEEFDEMPLDFEIYTPRLEISTPRVYARYRADFYDPIDESEQERLKKRSSLEILSSMSIAEANDLYLSACREYESLASFAKEGYFFSGSGSSFFRIKESENG